MLGIPRRKKYAGNYGSFNYISARYLNGSPDGSVVKNLPTMQETWVPSPGQGDLLEEDMATHSSTLAWEIPWTKEPEELQSMGS